MTVILNRRRFLQSLIALGAAYALPATATDKQVDTLWRKAVRSPWVFAVDEYNTITDPAAKDPETWGDVFEDIEVRRIRGWDDVIREVEDCIPLVSHFQTLAADELFDLQLTPPEELSPHQRKRLAALEADEDDGWRQWVELEGPRGVPRFKQAIAAWLAEPVDFMQSEWFPVNTGPQGKAKAFFEQLAWSTLDELGVVIVEGETPGSTYYAAELRVSIEQANRVAGELGLPIRFAG